ncbi:Rpn family recombination-promoting nuclease/putative transposase [Pseudobutyrivibrio xylanivorans]|uniref:Putative transposase, YhgA-like n=1 Tax=Pseudobutyrivibrio xylanivorans TaxID=185007 RepID=A0A1G5RTP7_PSEXY|nr:Rpn family recombination-promoting nuclease/putative transposase [Pseudobutyrivibrio xylanivorans]SCZ77495.1 Putative transposase, YhgA-like [Pseudobutyrivibrio xylanivorans]
MGKSDVLSCNVMDNPTYFADTINNGLFGGKEIVKSENLMELDSTESAILSDAFKKMASFKKERDILKRAKFLRDDVATYVIIGIENQTEIDYAMPVRTLCYDALRYYKQVTAISSANKSSGTNKKEPISGAEFLSGIRKDDKIEPVITLTVYYGTKEWDGPLSLHEMFSENVSPEILDLVSDYRLNLLEPKKITRWDSFKTDVGILFELISASDKKNGIRDLIRRNPEKFNDVNNEIVRAVNFYTKCDIQVNELEETTNMCYAWESSMDEARGEGEEKGRIEGRIEGRDEGRDAMMEIFSWLKDSGRLDEAIAVMDKENVELRDKLFKEFEASKVK